MPKKQLSKTALDDALKVLKKENKLTETYKMKDCNHDFEGKEEELTKIICNFLKKIK